MDNQLENENLTQLVANDEHKRKLEVSLNDCREKMHQFHSENLQKEDCSEVDPRLVTKLLICPFCFCKLASKKDAENHVFIHHKVDAATFQNLNLNFDSMEV